MFSSKIELQSPATSHFEDDLKHFNTVETYVKYAHYE